MARSSRSKTNQDFENMSDADLVAFIGGDVDPKTARADLIVLAIETDEGRQ
ncbi:MAG: hypothetical protein JWS12_839 [Candidatus Saccharibacteria bacterium]|nr:hypothetical protein [Candidatus Saccharibacteria bacterium]